MCHRQEWRICPRTWGYQQHETVTDSPITPSDAAACDFEVRDRVFSVIRYLKIIPVELAAVKLNFKFKRSYRSMSKYVSARHKSQQAYKVFTQMVNIHMPQDIGLPEALCWSDEAYLAFADPVDVADPRRHRWVIYPSILMCKTNIVKRDKHVALDIYNV